MEKFQCASDIKRLMNVHLFTVIVKVQMKERKSVLQTIKQGKIIKALFDKGEMALGIQSNQIF